MAMKLTFAARRLFLVFAVFSCTGPSAVVADGNRLAHLDEPNNPWQFERGSAKLVTPQWIGEEGVEAVLVLAIDDMSGDGQGFRNYLSPIIARLQQIDGRGPVSITCMRPKVNHPNMQWFLEQGVSLETHTLSHPCPLLQRDNFGAAWVDFHGCIDHLAQIPNNRSVGFRFPCMDGQNTPSPRAYAEFLSGTSVEGNFVTSSSSVGVVFTPGDPELPQPLFEGDPAGAQRFSKYLMKGFVNYIEDYPYPFVVGKLIWEVPFVYPNDYTGQALNGAQNPMMIDDFKAAVDATVAKQGAVSLCFHAGGWMSNEQMVEIVDHADRTHGRKVKFLNMREMDECLVTHMLAGHPLRDSKGRDNGVRIFDIDHDGFMDVLITNAKAKLCRLWLPAERKWKESRLPADMGAGLRFGIVEGRTVAVSLSRPGLLKAWAFTEGTWKSKQSLERKIDPETAPGGVRLLDIDGDGTCELFDASQIYRLIDGSWKVLPFRLPEGTAIETTSGGDAGLRFADIDDDGRQDVIFSNAKRFGTWLFESMEKGWTRRGVHGERTSEGVGKDHPRSRDVLAPFVRADGSNNGAWIKRGHIYWQNEDTGATLPYHIDQRTFGDLLGEQANQPRKATSSLRAMEARPGFRVELVAAEPLVMDPVDVAWGPDGTMWVAEMADYPMGLDHKGKPGGRVVAIKDTDGDGRYDQRILFADGLETANTVLPWRDGVLAVAPPTIWFLRDTTGDGEADVKEALYEGFGRGNEQHRGNGLAWGLDGWVYVANGDSGGTLRSTRSNQELKLGGFDLRIKPDTGEIEPATGMTQHGRNRDDWGNWVAGNNSSGWQIALEDHDARRNPAVEQPPARHGINGVINLFPISRVLSHYEGYRAPAAGSPGALTSACGYTFYRDSLFDGLIEPSVYFSCPVHNCVHREVITWDGVLMETERASDESRSEFLRSSDAWFRPTSIRTGPDGAMYVADMYRLVIEHPQWIDNTLEKQLIEDGRLRAGHDCGRIYRVFPEGAALHPRAGLAGRDAAGLARAMDTSNGWQRDTAHMMLTWLSKDEQQKAVPGLLKAMKSEHPAARAQALSALQDLGALSAQAMRAGIHDEHAGVRRNALRVGAHLFNAHSELGQRAVELLDDEDAHVQRRAAYALADWDNPQAGQALGRFLVKHADRPYLRAAALTSAGAFPDEVLITVLAMQRNATTIGLGTELMSMLGDDVKTFVPPVLERIAAKPAGGKPYESWKLLAATRLLEAVGEDSSVRAKIAPMLAGARAIVEDGRGELARRLAAVHFIARATGEGGQDVERLVALLKLTTPIELQVAAVKALLRNDADATNAKSLLARWSEHGPALRGSILDALLSRPALTGILLDALAGDAELAASIDVSRRGLLLRHADEAIRKRAVVLLGGSTRPDRAAVMKEYGPSLTKAGHRERGRTVFARSCAACHRLDGMGQAVGPNLAAMSNRSPATYLTAIIDPNRAIEGKWMQFTAKTRDGSTLAGAVAEETSSAITLVGIDGTRTKIPRGELAALQSTGISLMPEGLEGAISVDEMADLLTYLRSSGQPLPGVVVVGNTIEHLDAKHDGFYSITFDPVPGATGIELEWANTGGYKHWTIREVEAYAGFDTLVDIVDGTVLPGPARSGNHGLPMAFDGKVETFTYTTPSYADRAPQRTLLKLEPGSHAVDRIRINHVGGNDGNGRLQQITVRVTTDTDADIGSRKYADVTNLAVHLFGDDSATVAEVAKPKPKPERKPGPFGGKPQKIPGKVEAEHYDEGPAGVAYKDNDKGNQGAPYRKNTEVDIEKRGDASNGHGIGWMNAGEWLNYTIDVAEDGTYDIAMPVACAGQGGLIHLEIDGTNLTGPIRIPDTGGWKKLKTITHKGVTLEKGTHVLRLVLDKNGASGFVGDLDCLVFERSGE